jgi:tRNA threonylcarbamoyladenosine dehydratase
MDSAWQTRTKALLGDKDIEILKNSCVAVVGLGGVGSFVFEALVRAGVGKIVIIDHDSVEKSNINRQLVAKKSTIGKDKVEVAKNHALDINDEVEILAYKEFISKENAADFISDDVDIIIDAIDSVNSKVDLIEYAKENNIEILSSMGTANKLDPLKFKFDDISKTSVDPLAKVMRKELKDKGIKDIKVVYSLEKPIINKEDSTLLGSVSFVPSVCGLILASKAVEYLVNKTWS